jgi:hypothetical protein
MLDCFIIIYYLCEMEYINRENKIHTFTLDGDGNILWEGDFFYSRRLFSVETLKTEAVDPSGGPFISVGSDMDYIDDSFKGKIVDGFEQTENGYKILIKDESKTL